MGGVEGEAATNAYPFTNGGGETCPPGVDNDRSDTLSGEAAFLQASVSVDSSRSIPPTASIPHERYGRVIFETGSVTMDPEGVCAVLDRVGGSHADPISPDVPFVRGKYDVETASRGRLQASERVLGAPNFSGGPVVGPGPPLVPRGPHV